VESAFSVGSIGASALLVKKKDGRSDDAILFRMYVNLQRLTTGEMPVCQIFVDEQPVILYNDTQELNTVLIQSGGGTGPMKPGNRHAVRDQVPIPARQVS
jgi:predicted esterase